MHIAPGQGPTAHWGQNFDVSIKALSLKILYILFHAFIHGHGEDNPLGIKF